MNMMLMAAVMVMGAAVGIRHVRGRRVQRTLHVSPPTPLLSSMAVVREGALVGRRVGKADAAAVRYLTLSPRPAGDAGAQLLRLRYRSFPQQHSFAAATTDDERPRRWGGNSCRCRIQHFFADANACRHNNAEGARRLGEVNRAVDGSCANGGGRRGRERC